MSNPDKPEPKREMRERNFLTQSSQRVSQSLQSIPFANFALKNNHIKIEYSAKNYINFGNKILKTRFFKADKIFKPEFTNCK
jgi:hypothetical protein